MTPNNIANMAKLKGLDCIALTDHNSCGNCRATESVALSLGLGFIAGMEVNTSEDIHALCLFPSCDSAEGFSRYIYSLLPNILNKPKIFGEQLCLDAEDNVVYYEKKLLIVAANISINSLEATVAGFDGVCLPAHIDKYANSILETLGDIPKECHFEYCEITKIFSKDKKPQVWDAILRHNLTPIQNSDAHYLADISEADAPFPLKDDNLGSLIMSAISKATKYSAV